MRHSSNIQNRTIFVGVFYTMDGGLVKGEDLQENSIRHIWM